MGNKRKEEKIREYVKKWDVKNKGKKFTLSTFAYWFNQDYGRFAMSSSGFRVYFLRMERDGLILVNRDENNSIINYEIMGDNDGNSR